MRSCRKLQPRMQRPCSHVQALWWAWSHAQRMKRLQSSEQQRQWNSNHKEESPESAQAERHMLARGQLQSGTASSRRSLHAHRLSLSCQRYTSEVAARIRQSIDGFEYMQDASSLTSRRSFSIDEEDLNDDVTDDHNRSESDQAEIVRLQRLWQHHLQQATMHSS